MPVLGVDGCPGGWVGARARAGRAATAGRRRADDRRSSSRPCGPTSTCGGRARHPDRPAGQHDPPGRRAGPSRAARPGELGVHHPDPTGLPRRTAAEADAVNRGLSGQGVGAQAFALRDKILEVDAWLRGRAHRRGRRGAPRGVVHDDGRRLPCPASAPPRGRPARLDALAAAGVARPSVLQGHGYAPDDVLDACAVAWTAHRHAVGDARSLPDPPEVFCDGIPAAIVV